MRRYHIASQRHGTLIAVITAQVVSALRLRYRPRLSESVAASVPEDSGDA